MTEQRTVIDNNAEAQHVYEALRPESLSEVRDFYYLVIDKGTNGAGWVKGIYPSDEMIEDALAAGELYATRGVDGSIVALTMVNAACNDEYEGAAWGVDCEPGEYLVPHALAVSPDHLREGLGRATIRLVIDLARERKMKAVRLDVLAGNDAALALYRSVGFYMVGSSWMFYEDTGWAEYWLMELPLGDSEDVGVGAFRPHSRINQEYLGREKASSGSGPSHGYTPEMEELAYLITHPDGDPNTNFRRLGFGGSHLG